MKKQGILVFCLLSFLLAAPSLLSASPGKVVVADFQGDGRLGDLGAGLAAACRSALGPASVSTSRLEEAMRGAGLDPDRGPEIPDRDLPAFAKAAGAALMVSGRLFVCPAGTRLVIRTLDRAGKTVETESLTASGPHAWPALTGRLVRHVGRRAGLDDPLEPPEAMRPPLESYGRALREEREGRWEKSMEALGRAFRQNPAMTGYLEKSGGLVSELDRTAETDRDRARLLMQVDRSGEAAEILGRRARRTPGDSGTRLLYGSALRESGRPEKALAVLEPLAEKAPEDPDIRIALGRARTAAGRPEEAEAVLKTLAGPDARNPEAALALAEAMKKSGKGKAAAALCAAAGNTLAYQGKLDRANEALATALAQDPEQGGPARDLRPAYLTMDQARIVQAQLMQELGAAEPGDPAVLYAKGMLLPREGREQETARALQDFLIAEPDHGSALGEMGRRAAAEGDHEKAVLLLERATVGPSEPEELMRLALEYQALGQPEKALQTLERIESGPGETHIQALTQEAILHLESGNMQGAKQALDRVLELQPDHAAAHRVKARVLAASGWDGGAALEMKKAARLDPGGLEMPLFSPAGTARFQGTVLQAPDDPRAGETAEALYGLLSSFPVLSGRSDEERRDVWVGVEVRGLDGQPFTSLFRLSPKLLARDAAWVLSHRMGYPELVSTRVPALHSGEPAREAVLAEMIRQGLAFFVLLTVHTDGEPNIEARVYDALSGGEWRNSVSVDAIGLSPLEELNRPFLALLASPLLLCLLVLLILWVRGTGTLIVEEEHDTSVERAFFSVLISRRKLGPPLKKGDELTYLETVAAKGREKSKYSANLVGRHTVFEKLPTRFFYVYFYGVLVDAEVPIGSYSLEKEVRIRRGRRERVKFDLTPKEATVHVQTLFQGEFCYGAEVWVNEDRFHSVYTKDGNQGGVDGALIRLPRGEHTIHVFFADRTASHSVTVEDMSRQAVFVEVGKPEPRAN